MYVVRRTWQQPCSFTSYTSPGCNFSSNNQNQRQACLASNNIHPLFPKHFSHWVAPHVASIRRAAPNLCLQYLDRYLPPSLRYIRIHARLASRRQLTLGNISATIPSHDKRLLFCSPTYRPGQRRECRHCSTRVCISRRPPPLVPCSIRAG